MEAEDFRALARELLSPRRYEHTLAVARLAQELAERHGADARAAGEAGLLHDLMKERTAQELLQRIEKSGILVENPAVRDAGALHALAGYCYARDELGVRDGDVLNAVRYHTTGRAGMSPLEKVVFLADKYSYDRTYPNVEKYRETAFRDLNEGMLVFLDFQIPRLMECRSYIDPAAIGCYNSLIEEIQHAARR